MQVGEKIRHLMGKQRITFEGLAEKAGVARKTVELAISDPGSRTLDTLSKIAKALDVSLSYLIEPVLPWEGAGAGPRKQVYLSLPEDELEILTARAKDLGVPRSEYIEAILSQAVRMYRVLCDNCDGIFWVEQEKGWECCPYCGKKAEDSIIE